MPIAVLGDMNSTGWLHDEASPERTFIHGITAEHGFEVQTADLRCTEYWRPKDSHDYQPSMLDHIVTRGATWSDAEVLGHCARSACRAVDPAELDADYTVVSDHCAVVLDGSLRAVD